MPATHRDPDVLVDLMLAVAKRSAVTDFADTPAAGPLARWPTGWARRFVDACLLALSYWLAFELRFDDSMPHRFDSLYGKTVWVVVVTNMLGVRRVALLHQVVALHEPAGPSGHRPRRRDRGLLVITI